MVQRLRVGAQVPLGLAITARSQLGLLEGEIAREQGAEGLDRPCPDLLFFAGRIAAERAGGKYVLKPACGPRPGRAPPLRPRSFAASCRRGRIEPPTFSSRRRASARRSQGDRRRSKVRSDAPAGRVSALMVVMVSRTLNPHLAGQDMGRSVLPSRAFFCLFWFEGK